jgi:cytochrome P450
MSQTSKLALPLAPELLNPHTPIHYDQTRQTWHVFRYADVQRVLTSHAEFSQEYLDTTHMQARTATPVAPHPAYAAMWGRDGDAHKDLRGLVREPFSPRTLKLLEEQVRAIADELLDGVISARTGEVEFMGAFARAFTNRVICNIMGVDMTYDTQFARWVEEFTAAQVINQVPPQLDLVAFFSRLLAERRRIPGQGLVDALLAFVEYGCLEELAADRSRLPVAIEEALRWNPSFPAVLLWARKDLSLGGHDVRAGQAVTAWISAANRDPAKFDDPDSFNFRRQPNPHLSFGWARHLCLGKPLAQLELRVAMEALLERLPLPIELALDKPVTYRQGIVNALVEAHFRFFPGAVAVADRT